MCCGFYTTVWDQIEDGLKHPALFFYIQFQFESRSQGSNMFIYVRNIGSCVNVTVVYTESSRIYANIQTHNP